MERGGALLMLPLVAAPANGATAAWLARRIISLTAAVAFLVTKGCAPGSTCSVCHVLNRERVQMDTDRRTN